MKRSSPTDPASASNIDAARSEHETPLHRATGSCDAPVTAAGEVPEGTHQPHDTNHDAEVTILAAGHLESRAAQDRALTGLDGPHRQWVAQTIDDPGDEAVPLADVPAAISASRDDGTAADRPSDTGNGEDANSQLRTFFANDGD